MGYVLEQFLDGKDHVIAYDGHELNHAETRYITTEREVPAVVGSIKRYQPYLSCKKFYVYTDHGSLSWLMSVKDPTSCLAHWALSVQQYDFDIIHRLGITNGNAEALSHRRYYSTVSSPPLASTDFPVAVLGDACPGPNTLYDLQCKDRDLAAIVTYLESLNCWKVTVKHVHCYSQLTNSTLTVMQFFLIYGHLANAVLSCYAHRLLSRRLCVMNWSLLYMMI